MANITLTAPTTDLPASISIDNVVLRPLVIDDAEELGRLYVRSYPAEVIEGMDQEASIGDMIDTFTGAYGVILPTATLGAIVDDHLAAVVMTVVESPWHDTPSGPFVIEVFTEPALRGRGLARLALTAAMRAIAPLSVSLRVDPANTPAMALYRSMGFMEAERYRP